MSKNFPVFINPNLVIQKGDFLGSGIPFMPHILAYTVGYLKKYGIKVKVIDSFAENPFKLKKRNGFYWQGISIEKIIKKINKKQKSIFIYASAITNYNFNLELIKEIRKNFSKIKIIVLANTQAVTAFNIIPVSREILTAGANFIVYNNIEKTTKKLIENNFSSRGMKNLIYIESNKTVTTPMSFKIGNTNELTFPAWEEFPLKNYWKLGYSHGPVEEKFLAILTSYGCPYQCKFCVNPSVNKSRWQPKPAKFVYQEMNYLFKKFGVREFHVEDLNPTIDKERIKKLCHLIIKNNLKIKWKLASGTKAETLNPQTLKLMRDAGCNYISISPETGSEKVLKLMNKQFDYKHAEKIMRTCKKLGIKTQACFVLGFPGEKQKDLWKTEQYIEKITKLGVDEIALFIVTPLPGSYLFGRLKGYKNLSSLTFSPKWRKDYDSLGKFRIRLYFKFVLWKIIYHPLKIFQQGVNFFRREFGTKMEMIPYRIIRFNFLLLQNKLKKSFFLD